MKLELKNRKNNNEDINGAQIVTELELESLRMLEMAEKTGTELKNKYAEMGLLDDGKAEIEKNKARLNSYKRAESNILRAFKRTLVMCDEFGARLEDISKSRQKVRILPRAPSNTAVDAQELASGHFAGGLSLYKLLIICFAGSIFGVIVELLWCLVKNGYIESRSGLVWGPFNLLYGFAAVVLTASLYRLRNHSKLPTFAGAFLVGSAVEYFCSWAQEAVFGSVSWDYSAQPFNLNGRICLLYSLFWGALGVLWVKDIYPRLAKLILKIPEKQGKIITVSFTVFLVVNALVTCIAVFRWSQRIDGIEAANVFWEFIDSRFTDDRMVSIFPNMKFK